MNLFNRRSLNVVFALHLIFFGLVLVGLLDRSWVLYETIIISLYTIMAPLEDGTVFFVRSIPLFLAIPLTATFDNFNQWRILSVILFLKWLIQPSVLKYLIEQKKLFFTKPWQTIKNHPLAFALKVLGFLAILSLWHAPDRGAGVKRILYFLNASLIGILVWWLAQSREYTRRLIKNISIPVIIVALVGVIQVVATYFIDIYQFMRIWGEGIQLREFGTQWSYIATHVGNTWFAYFGDQLSLRVFSLFPDSHSFPIFLLLGLPALFAWAIIKPLGQAERFKKMLMTRSSIAVLWIPLVFLMIILSGTRGMWLAGGAMIVWSAIIVWWLRRDKATPEQTNIFTYVASFLALFILLFAVAYPIFSSPQFLVSKGDSLLLEHRLKSILDFGETSNSARIAIWKASAVSIAHHPILGVGISNFPVVLGQNILLTKAGSSAHNIYIHMAAEMGVLAFLVTLYLLWLIVQKIYRRFIDAESPQTKAYFAALLITIPWIFAYLMTDVALFDERALLAFAVTLGLLFAW